MVRIPRFSVGLLAGLLLGCTGKPDGIEPVQDFQLERYLGRWYEIARLDHRFERGLTHVTADYSRRDDGGVNVVNRGYDTEAGEWKSARGKAYFVDGPNVGYLKVSFFGPFYGAYVVFALDHDNYQYAMISGPNRSYLWILARDPDLDERIVQRLMARAKRLGFDTDQLIRVNQSQATLPAEDRP